MQADKVIEHIVNWLKDYATNAGIKGFVIGISGGIDSAVTSSLCAKTGLDLLCIEMPIHQADSQVSRAKEHINQLKTRARLRMTTLYYFAGLHKYLVAGTGNKVEDFGVGFYTKYGDGGVDLSPIADLMKSQVYAIARLLKVPSSIQKAKPTDGLWGDDRTDEDQIGATYDQLEWAMYQIEEGRSPNDFEGKHRRVLELYLKLHRANLHKMNPIPVCEIPFHLMN